MAREIEIVDWPSNKSWPETELGTMRRFVTGDGRETVHVDMDELSYEEDE